MAWRGPGREVAQLGRNRIVVAIIHNDAERLQDRDAGLPHTSTSWDAVGSEGWIVLAHAAIKINGQGVQRQEPERSKEGGGALDLELLPCTVGEPSSFFTGCRGGGGLAS